MALENSGLIYYPPSHNRLTLLFAKYATLAITLLLFAYAYGRWIHELMPDWTGFVVVFAVLLVTLWIYRIEKVWNFQWSDRLVTVFLKQNLMMFVWIDIKVDDVELLTRSCWMRGGVIGLHESLRYSNKKLLVVVNFRKTKEPHLVECAVKFEGKSLIT